MVLALTGVLLTLVFLLLISRVAILERVPFCDEGHWQYGVVSVCRARER